MAKEMYEQSSYSAASDLFKTFLEKYPKSQLRFEAQLYSAQCLFKEGQTLQAREALNDLERSFVPYDIEDRLYYWLSIVYLKVKDYESANAYAQKLKKSHPDSPLIIDIQFELARAFSADKKIEQAQEIYDELLSLKTHPLKEQALFERACLFYENQNYEKAIKDFTLFSDAFLDSDRLAEAHFYVAESYFYRGDFASAVKHYKISLEKSAEDSVRVLCFLGLGWSYLHTDQLVDAEAALLKVKGSEESLTQTERESFYSAQALFLIRRSDYEGALEYYEKIISLNLSTQALMQALFGKADCLRFLGRGEEAKNTYEQIVAHENSSLDDSVKAIIAKAYYQLGEISFSAHENDRAVVLFEKVLSLGTDPQVRLGALFQLASVYQDLQDNKKALAMYEEINVAYPDNTYADYVEYERGRLMLLSGEVQTALSSFIEFNKHHAHSDFLDDVNYYLGVAYFKCDKFAESAKQFNNFLSVFLGSPYRNDALYLFAVAQYQQGKLQDAIDSFTKLLSYLKKEDDAELIEKAEYELALALYEAGQVQDAAERLSEFIRQHPTSSFVPGAMLWLGQYYYKDRQFDQALKQFETFIRTFPNDALVPEAYHQISLVYLVQERYDDALRVLKRSLETATNSVYMAKTMLTIGDLYAQQGRAEEAVAAYKELTQSFSFNNIKDGLAEQQESARLASTKVRATDGVVAGLPLLSNEEPGESHYIQLAFVRLGDYYKEKKDFKEAMVCFQRAREAGSGQSQAEIQFKLAETYEESAEPGLAIEAYAAIAQDDQMSSSWAIKGLLRAAALCEAQNDLSRALELLKKVEALGVGESKFAAEKIEALSKFKQ